MNLTLPELTSSRYRSPSQGMRKIIGAEELSAKHPDNHNIRAKIRQQLQYLRDKGFIEFLGGGRYRKIRR